MNKFIRIIEFEQQLFTDERSAYQASKIIEGIMEETFRDCKDLLQLGKMTNKQQRYLEQMIALSLIAYVAGLWLGEAVRDVVFGKLSVAQIPAALLKQPGVDPDQHPKWSLYSGLLVLLKQKRKLSRKEFAKVSEAYLDT